MSQDEMWEAAEFITEWDHEGLRYTALEVPREVIDEDCDDSILVLMVVAMDNGGVRRVEEVFDPLYERMEYFGAKEKLREVLEHAPEDVRDFVEEHEILES